MRVVLAAARRDYQRMRFFDQQQPARQPEGSIVFPVCADHNVFETEQAWAGELRARTIGDFGSWEDQGAYEATFKKLLSDLRIER